MQDQYKSYVDLQIDSPSNIQQTWQNTNRQLNTRGKFNFNMQTIDGDISPNMSGEDLSPMQKDTNIPIKIIKRTSSLQQQTKKDNLRTQSKKNSQIVSISQQCDNNSIRKISNTGSHFRRKASEDSKQFTLIQKNLENDDYIDENLQVHEQINQMYNNYQKNYSQNQYNTIISYKNKNRKNDKKIENTEQKKNTKKKSKYKNLQGAKELGVELGVLLKIHRFVRRIKQFAIKKNPQELNQKQIDIINDLSFTSLKDTVKKKSFFRCDFQKKGFFSAVIHPIFEQLDKYGVIDPMKSFTIIREFIHIFFIIFTMLYVPIEIINEISMKEKYGGWISWIINVTYFFFISDIIIKFNTGIYEKGIIIKNRKDIAIQYCQDQFLRDIIALVPLMISGDSSGWNYLNLAIFVKVTTVQRILQNIQDMVSYLKPNSKYPGLIQLIRLGMTVLFVSHIVACLFQYLAYIQEQYVPENHTWIEELQIKDHAWYTKYIYALHFATTTMTTVGYGDLTPQSTLETGFVVVAMLFSCSIFAYSFNQIGQIISDMNANQRAFKKQMSIINKYLEQKSSVSLETKNQVRKFLEFRFKSGSEMSQQEQQLVISKLPDHLIEKVKFEANSLIIQQCKQFFGFFSNEFQDKLSMQFQEIKVSKNEILYEEGDVEEDPLFFYVEKGQIEIYNDSVKGEFENTQIQLLEGGSYFGESGFLINQPRQTCARVNEYTILHTISRNAFEEILQEFPSDLEKYYSLRDKLQYTQSKTYLHSRCYICNEFNHSSNECPYVHHVQDKEQLILKKQFSVPQIRFKNIQRRSKKYDKTLGLIQQNKEAIRKIKTSTILLNDIHNLEAQCGLLQNLPNKQSAQSQKFDQKSELQYLINQNNMVQRVKRKCAIQGYLMQKPSRATQKKELIQQIQELEQEKLYPMKNNNYLSFQEKLPDNFLNQSHQNNKLGYSGKSYFEYRQQRLKKQLKIEENLEENCQELEAFSFINFNHFYYPNYNISHILYKQNQQKMDEKLEHMFINNKIRKYNEKLKIIQEDPEQSGKINTNQNKMAKFYQATLRSPNNDKKLQNLSKNINENSNNNKNQNQSSKNVNDTPQSRLSSQKKTKTFVVSNESQQQDKNINIVINDTSNNTLSNNQNNQSYSQSFQKIIDEQFIDLPVFDKQQKQLTEQFLIYGFQNSKLYDDLKKEYFKVQRHLKIYQNIKNQKQQQQIMISSSQNPSRKSSVSIENSQDVQFNQFNKNIQQLQNIEDYNEMDDVVLK